MVLDRSQESLVVEVRDLQEHCWARQLLFLEGGQGLLLSCFRSLRYGGHLPFLPVEIHIPVLVVYVDGQEPAVARTLYLELELLMLCPVRVGPF